MVSFIYGKSVVWGIGLEKYVGKANIKDLWTLATIAPVFPTLCIGLYPLGDIRAPT